MTSSASSCASLIHESISQANVELEKAWERVFALADPATDPENSSIAFRRLVSYNPTNATVAHSFPNVKKAVEIISQVINARAAQIQADPRNPEHYVILGHCYLILNDFPNAFTSYSHVLRLGVPVDSAWFHYAHGCVLHHFKYDRDAHEHMQDAIRQSPHFHARADLRLRMAFIQRGLGDYDSAISTLESILQPTLPLRLSPDDILFQIAYTHQRANHTEKAGQVYGELYKRHPNSIEVIQQYCWFLSLQYDRGAFEKAERIIQQSGQQGEPVLRLVAARIAMKQQDMTLAYQRYCECISFWTDSPLFWCGLGVLYFKNDQMQDAIVAFQRALYLKPELAEAWANLGLIFELQRETGTAIQVYQQALQSCSEKDARVVRDRLNVINGGKPRPVAATHIIEINDAAFFVQVAERIAGEWVADSPAIPAKLIGVDDVLDSIISELTPPHRSIF